jgi:DNA primase
LRRLDCRTVTLLFDGDAAGVAAAGKAAGALLPSGLMGRVALLPREAGKTDPDEYARREGAAAVEKLIAAAQPLTEYLIDCAIAAHCGAKPSGSSFEERMRAYSELRPLLDGMPPGLARQTFEDRVAKRIDLSPEAVARELGSARPMAAGPRAAPVESRVRSSVLGSSAIDALGLLAAFPNLTEVAREEGLVALFRGLPLAEVARGLVDEILTGDAVLVCLEPLVPRSALRRVESLIAAGRPEPAQAEREFRKATVEAKIEQLRYEIDRLTAEVATCDPIPEALRTAMLEATRRRSELEKRRDGRRPG